MAYGIALITPPNGPAVSLAMARTWLLFDSDCTEQDSLIWGLILTATELAQNVTGRQFVSATYRMDVDCFPSFYGNWGVWGGIGGGSTIPGVGYGTSPYTQGAGQWGWKWWADHQTFRMPYAPLQFVNAITFVDQNGVTQCLSNSVSAPILSGTQTVTPYTMKGISVGTSLIVDTGTVQETITVSSVTTTTFTATFANAHSAYVMLYNAAYITAGSAGEPPLVVANTKEPGLVSVGFGNIWPTTLSNFNAVSVYFTCGYGPTTSISSAISSGTQTVTPATMQGIFPGTSLYIDVGATQELVVVSSVTTTTFTATFNQSHNGAPTLVSPGMPQMVYTAIELALNYWFENRGDAMSTLDFSPAIIGLLQGAWTGEIPDSLPYVF